MVFFGTIRQKALHQATSPKIYFFGRCDNLPILQDLVAEGYNITPEILARLGPFRTAHVNRFQKFSTAIFERIVAIPQLDSAIGNLLGKTTYFFV